MLQQKTETMKQYNRLNIGLGWLSFAIAAFTYLSTMEPTASFWDCGEFIASAYRLLVGHPPGAPVFMLTGRVFTMLAGGDTSKVAIMVNALSALASAFTILFLFWSITHLAKKLVVKAGEKISLGQTLAVMGAGLVGALAYTFSDTFWFSAVEGEVYASSSLFTAVAFWAILKWENEADQPHATRWIILIGYFIGLSIGVHLLNLLTIPALGLVYYFRKYKDSEKGITPKGTAMAVIVSGVILLAIMYGIIPGTVKLAAAFELMFVNGLGLPYNTGVFFFIILVIVGLVYGILYTIKKGKVLGNTILTFVAVILVGYSSFAVIIIRSNANPPMDQNSPDNMFSLLSYLNREQYGDRPLIYGQSYDAPIADVTEGKKVRYPMNGRYETIDHRQEIEYNSKFKSLFPRMYSSQPRHIQAYESWGRVKGRKIKARDYQTGEMKTFTQPTMGENLRFFISYQMNFMYWRYFMWNFAGRQNDIQGHGELDKGNWLSGIPVIDNPRLGDQSLLPDSMKANKAYNKYYMLPLLLGFLGIIIQLVKWKEGGYENFWLVMMLFFMTGIAIVIYLNQYPFQPRERDYAYAGSFYAFSIWIGLGVIFIWDALKKYVGSVPTAGAVTLASLVLVPGIMAKENWDDHDRSDRYVTRDFAKNYLNSCDEDAIIFTNGDNDTFPLWYAQEVEGERTDVRVCNLSYLQTDWYIDQMRQKAYDSDPLPFSLTADKTIQGKSDVVYLFDRIGGKPVDLNAALNYLASDKVETKNIGQGRKIDHFPSKKLRIPVDSARVVNMHMVPEGKEDRIVDELEINFGQGKNLIRKNDLMVLDLLATNNWERPVYYAVTVPSDNWVGLKKYFHTEGLTYKIAPVVAKPTEGETGEVNTAKMYDNMMHKFVWGNVDKPGVWLDENTLRMCLNYRNNFVRLANALMDEGKVDSAQNVLKKCLTVLPSENVPFDNWSLPLAEACYQAGLTTEANDIVKVIHKDQDQMLRYCMAMKPGLRNQMAQNMQYAFYILDNLRQMTSQYKQTDLTKSIQETFGTYSGQFMQSAK